MQRQALGMQLAAASTRRPFRPSTTPLDIKGDTMKHLTRLSCAALVAALPLAASAADWSDTSIGFRTGSKFAEPFGTNDIHKNIVSLTHASGYKYGSNFFNADFLMSDDKDPSAFGSTNGAHEVYIVYRNTLDIEKISGTPMKFGPVRGAGVTVGFDVNAKTDVGYNSKKRMLVLGPTLMFDVPGFLNVSLLALFESNQPTGKAFTPAPVDYSVSRYGYKAHPMLTAAWSIPIGGLPLAFEGFANWIASKGKNEFGGDTAPETNIDMQVMYDVSTLYGGKGTFKAGIGYQYWRNKFGNPTTAAGAGAGPGATAKTPMLRAEYHF
jgi:nucleoside-specific outer membrane channel protein Tsx